MLDAGQYTKLSSSSLEFDRARAGIDRPPGHHILRTKKLRKRPVECVVYPYLAQWQLSIGENHRLRSVRSRENIRFARKGLAVGGSYDVLVGKIPETILRWPALLRRSTENERSFCKNFEGCRKERVFGFKHILKGCTHPHVLEYCSLLLQSDR